MKYIQKIHLNKRLEVLLVGVTLLLGFLFAVANVAAEPPNAGLTQETPPLIIEGRVEQIIAEGQPDGLIISRAFISVETVVEGTLQGNQVVVRYQGGTVGDTTLVVSHQPRLASGMRIWVRLTPDESGDYRIDYPDADLVVLEAPLGVTYNPSGKTWADSSIPVPMRVNANTNDVPGDGERTAVINAMNTWSSVSCSSFAYQYESGSCTAGPALNGENCVSWVNQTNGSSLGTSYWWHDGKGNLIESDIIFYNGSGFPDWTTSTSSVGNDVESMALHELGHSLGLNHNNSSSNIVMYWGLSYGTLRRSLHPDDINGLCDLYPADSSSPPSNPPNAPNGLNANSISKSRIDLSWNDNSGNENGFKIERSPNGSNNWSQIATVGANVTSYSNTNLSCGTTYYYRVRAYNNDGNSGYSNVDNAKTVVCNPSAPGNLTASPVSKSRIDISWNDNSGNESGFKIERSPNGSNNWSQIATVGANVTSYSNTNLSCNTTYYYRIRAYNAGGNSSYSNVDNAKTVVCTPNAPNGLNANSVSKSRIDISWNDNSGNENGFKIQRSPNGSNNWSQIATVGANVTSYSNTNLSCNTTYYYRVRAHNAGGNSGYSNVDNAKTASCAPAAPSSLSAVVANTNHINLSWHDNSNNEYGFKIERAANNGLNSWTQIGIVGANTTSFANTGLPHTNYIYRVRAYNDSSHSNYSNTANAVTLNHTYYLPLIWRNN